MQEMDNAHLATWLHCLTSSSTLEHARDPRDMDILADWLDLPYSYGGAELKSRSRSADEEFIGSFATIASSYSARRPISQFIVVLMKQWKLLQIRALIRRMK